MGRLQLVPILAVVAVLAMLPVSQAFAQRPVQVVQTDCDTISLIPPLVRVSFGVINLGPTPVCSVRLIPIQSGTTPPDSCRIMECSNPPGWQCQVVPGGAASWITEPAGTPGCILTGQKHEPFDIVLDPLFCCYTVEYDGPDHQVFFTDVICFECLKPTATHHTTWGNLKAIYR